MSVCAVTDVNDFVKVTTETTCSQYVLVDALTYEDLQASTLTHLLEALDLYFAFDVETFGVINGTLMLAFLSAHFAGRVVKYLGKS